MKARALLRAILVRRDDRHAVKRASAEGPVSPRSDTTLAPTHRRTAFALVAFLALTGALGVAASPALAAGDANEASCPAATESSPGFRTYLPDCRAYELATPPTKNGSIVTNTNAISPDGERLIISAAGAFAGSESDLLDDGLEAVHYELARDGSGWTTSPLDPPISVFPYASLDAVEDSAELGTTLWSAEKSTARFHEEAYLRGPSGEFRLVGPLLGPELKSEAVGQGEELGFVAASANLKHSLFGEKASVENFRVVHDGHSNLWPGDTTREGDRSLYEYDYAGEPLAEPILVGVKNQGSVHHDTEAELISSCGTTLGSAGIEGGGESVFNAMSESGEVVYFSAAPCEGGPTARELYARVDGAQTVSISEPTAAACTACDISEPAPAVFAGASADGSVAYFTTPQKLFAGADDEAGDNLYQYRLHGGEEGSRVSFLASEVSGVSRISADGGSVYFVSQGRLTGPDTVTGRSPERTEPISGAQNLYLYQSGSGSTTFVASLLTSTEESELKAAESQEEGAVEALVFERFELAESAAVRKRERGEISAEEAEVLVHKAEEQESEEFSDDFALTPGRLGLSGSLAYDASVWEHSDSRPVQDAAEGRYLVFPSSADLTGGAGSEMAPQLFEFDAAGDSLVKVSGVPLGGATAPETFDAAPKLPVLLDNATQTPPSSQRLAISETGAVFFTSSAPLAVGAIPGATNVYEYRAGGVYLISDGHDTSEHANLPTVELGGIDPSATDVVFITADRLLPEDGEIQAAVYVARAGGGFPEGEVAGGCADETCQGPLAPAPAGTGPGTSSFTGPGNPPPAHRKGRHRRRHHHHRSAKRHRRRARRHIRDAGYQGVGGPR